MKNLLKRATFRVFLLYMIALSGELYGQATPVTVTNGVIALKGKGKLGGNKEGYQYYQYNTPVSGSFYLQAYFRNLTNSSQSYTGLAFRNIATYQQNDGGVAAVMLIYQNDSLKCLIKSAYNQKAVAFLISANIKIPGYLRLVKDGNDAKFYYSSQSESDVTINFISLGTVQNAFVGWTNITQNFITGSNNGVVQTALASKRVYGSLGNAPPVAPSLASNPASPVAGTSVTFTATGCTGTVGFLKNNAAITGSNPLTVSSPVANDYYSAKCVVSGVSSISSNVISIGDGQIVTGGGMVNTVPDLVIADYDKWNFFNSDDVGDFTIPKSYDAKSGQMLPNKGFIWHAPYRNLFGLNNTENERLIKMTKKGITAWNVTKLPTYYSGLESIVTPDRFVGDGKGLGINNGNPWPEEQTYNAFGIWAKSVFDGAGGYHQPFTNGKWSILAGILDYENLSTKLENQVDANRHSVGLLSMASITTGRVGFQYGVGQNTGGYYKSTSYNGGTNNVWALPADNTVPAEFVGKSAASNNRILGILEITYPYEAFLPENAQVKDQNGANWFNIRHFGAECDNTYNFNSTANAQHWATNVGVGTETTYKIHHAFPDGGQDVCIQLKPVSETDDAFHYGPINKQYRDNKVIQEYARYGITQLGTEYNPDGSIKRTFEFLNAPGSEYVPNFIAEGQPLMAYSCGAKLINWWSSDYTETAIPKLKVGNPRRGARYDDPTYGNRDLSAYIYTMKALWRMAQKVTMSDGRQFSCFDLCDGTEIYLNENTPVIYPGSSAITKLKALEWQTLKHTPVRAVVNVAKRAVYVYAAQAYGVEDASVRFVYNENGASIDETIQVPAGKHILKIFPFTAGTVVVDNNTVNPVTISANPTAPKAGSSVTFSSTACSGGTVKWFVADAQVSTGLSYTVANPTANDTYKATCTVGTVSSVASNGITIGAAPAVTTGVTITEPAKPPYFFSDGHPASYYASTSTLPAVKQHTSPAHYDETTECVVIKNANVKFVINLVRGGHICGAYKVGDPFNYVYNGYDGGFQIGIDMHQKPDKAYVQNGKSSADCQDDAGYNVTHGGTYTNGNGFSFTPTLIDYHAVGTNGYYIKFRPLFYTLSPGEFAQNYIEVTYTLLGDVLKCDYVYTSFRDDQNINTSFGFIGQSVPACFLVNQLTKFQYYAGTSPWTNGPLTDATIPWASATVPPGEAKSLEHWGFAYNPSTNLGFGVMNLSHYDTEAGMVFKQLEVNEFTMNGTEFTGGFTYISPTLSMQNFSSGVFTFNTSALITLGNIGTVRANLKEASGH